MLEEVKWVITAFDQANTSQRIENLGSRGKILKDAIEDLRKILLAQGVNPWDVQGVWVESPDNYKEKNDEVG